MGRNGSGPRNRILRGEYRGTNAGTGKDPDPRVGTGVGFDPPLRRSCPRSKLKMGIGPLKFEQRPVHNLLNNFPSLFPLLSFSLSLGRGIILIPRSQAISFPTIAHAARFLSFRVTTRSSCLRGDAPWRSYPWVKKL